MELGEKTVRRNYVYRGRIIGVRCDDALLPDGRPCKREVVEHPGGAAIFAAVDGRVALVRQFRYAYNEVLWEIPAGKLEPGEDPAAAAVRELSEETGLIAGSVSHLITIYPSPGYTDEQIYIYAANDVRCGERHLDEGEFLDAAFVPLEEARQMIKDGRIKDAKTVIALLSFVQ